MGNTKDNPQGYFQWEDQFRVVQKHNNNVLLLQQKGSRETHYGRQIIVSNQHDKADIERLIEAKTKASSPHITKLEKSLINKTENYCSTEEKYYILFENPGPTLKQEIRNRKLSGHKFNQKQVLSLIYNGAQGIKYLRDLSHPHENICAQSFFINKNKEIILGDPWITAPQQQLYKTSGAHNYPSSQRLSYRSDIIDRYDPYDSDLFSLGCVALQVLHQQSMDNIYNKNCTFIDHYIIGMKIQELTNQQIKLILQKLCSKNPRQRLQAYQILEQHRKKIVIQEIHNTNKQQRMSIHPGQKQNKQHHKLQHKHLEPIKQHHSNNRQTIPYNNIYTPMNNSLFNTPERIIQSKNYSIGQSISYSPGSQQPLNKAQTMIRVNNHPPNIKTGHIEYQNRLVQSISSNTKQFSRPNNLLSGRNFHYPQSRSLQRVTNYQPHNKINTSKKQYLPLGASMNPNKLWDNISSNQNGDKSSSLGKYSAAPREQTITNYQHLGGAFGTTFKKEPNRALGNPQIDRIPFTFNKLNEPDYSKTDYFKTDYSSIDKLVYGGLHNNLGNTYANSSETGSKFTNPFIEYSKLGTGSVPKVDTFKQIEEKINRQIQEIMSNNQYNKDLNKESRAPISSATSVMSPVKKMSVPVMEKSAEIEGSSRAESQVVLSDKLVISEGITLQHNIELPHDQNIRTNKQENREKEESIQDQGNMSTPKHNKPKKEKYNSTIKQVSEDQLSGEQHSRRYEYVIEEYDVGSRYEGYKLNDKREGRGKFFYKEGSYYDGQWKDNKMHGTGTLYYANGKVAYDGQWYMDQFSGEGKVFNDQKTTLLGPFDYTDFYKLQDNWEFYEGQLLSDSRHGKGKIKLINGQIFIGNFEKDKANGDGKFYTLSGQVINGKWINNKLVERYD